MADQPSRATQTIGGAIVLHHRREQLLVILSGDIDASLRDEAGAALLQVSMTEVPVSFDTTRMRSIDSSGVAFLWQAAEVCAERHGVLTLVNPPEHLASELVELHVSNLFCIVRS